MRALEFDQPLDECPVSIGHAPHAHEIRVLDRTHVLAVDRPTERIAPCVGEPSFGSRMTGKRLSDCVSVVNEAPHDSDGNRWLAAGVPRCLKRTSVSLAIDRLDAPAPTAARGRAD